MKQLSLDFDNNCLCVMLPGQQGTEIVPELKKEDFRDFIPERYLSRASFTWDFEAECISINRPYKSINNFMTKECFVPETIEPMPGLANKFNDFIKLLNMEPVNLAEEIRKDMPEIAKLFGL